MKQILAAVTLIISPIICFGQVKSSKEVYGLNGKIKSVYSNCCEVELKRKDTLIINNKYSGFNHNRETVFNTKGQVLTKSNFHNDTLISQLVYNYNSKDLLISSCYLNKFRNLNYCDSTSYFDDDRIKAKYDLFLGKWMLTKQWTYNTKNELIRYQEFSAQQEASHTDFYIYPGLNDSIIRQTEFKPFSANKIYLDSNAYRYKLKELDPNKQTNRTVYFKNDSEGRLIEQDNANQKGKALTDIYSKFGRYRETFEYNAAGQLILHIDFNQNNEAEMKRRWIYKGDLLLGERLTEKSSTGKWILTEETNFDYDLDGNQIIKTTSQSNYSSRYERTYDDQGNWIKELHFVNDILKSINKRKMDYYF